MTTTQNTKTETAKAPDFIAYHVPDREQAPWTRIGAAWAHKDGKGFGLDLDLVPATGGRIVLRVNEPKQELETDANVDQMAPQAEMQAA